MAGRGFGVLCTRHGAGSKPNMGVERRQCRTNQPWSTRAVSYEPNAEGTIMPDLASSKLGNIYWGYLHQALGSHPQPGFNSIPTEVSEVVLLLYATLAFHTQTYRM